LALEQQAKTTNQENPTVRLNKTMVSPQKLSDALKVIGQKDITIRAGKDSVVALSNPQGETMVIAPMIDMGGGEASPGPTLEQINMSRQEEKQARAQVRQARQNLKELIRELYEKRDERLRAINYMDWDEPTEKFVKKTLAKMRRYPQEYKTLAEELWGREFFRNSLTGESYVTYRGRPPEWWAHLPQSREAIDVIQVTPQEFDEQQERYHQQLKEIRERIEERKEAIRKLKAQAEEFRRSEATWRQAGPLLRQVAELEEENRKDEKLLRRY